MIITTSYEGPDLDGYSCAVAYAELLRAQGKDAEAAIWDEPQFEVRWLLGELGLTPIGHPSLTDSLQVILLDTSNPESLPKSIKPEQVIEIIDHRKLTQLEVFPNAVAQVELVGAAATLVAERFRAAHLEPSKESAALLYGGILSNTQNFLGSQVTDRDRAMASWMQSLSGLDDGFVKRMFQAKSDLSGTRLEEVMLADEKLMMIAGHRIETSQIEVLGIEELFQSRRAEMEHILSHMASSQNAEYAFLNLKDLETGRGIILANDEATSTLLSRLTGIEWEGRAGRSTMYTLRKQVNVALAKILEKEKAS